VGNGSDVRGEAHAILGLALPPGPMVLFNILSGTMAVAEDNTKEQMDPKKGVFFDGNHLKEGLKKKALVGAGFSVFAQTVNYGIQTLGTIVMARILSPEDFGLVSMVATFSILFQNFGINGFTEAVIQRKELTNDQMKKLFWINFLIMAGLTVFFVVLSPAIAWFFGENQLKSISTGMALSIIFSGMGTCHLALLSRNMKFKLAAIAQVLAALISTVLGVILALEGFGFWSLIWRRVSLPFITAVFAWIFCRWKPGIPARGTSIRSILTFGYNTYANFLLSYLRNNLDKIFVGKAFGKGPLGHYDRASQLSALLPNQVTMALSGVGIATLSRLAEDLPRFRNYYSKALSVLAFLVFPGSVLFTLAGKDLIIAVLGSQWTGAGTIFAALGPGIGAFVIYNTNVWLHISLGRVDRLLKWGFVVLGTSILFYSLGLLFGPIGVAIAYSAMFYILLIPALQYAGRPAGLSASFFLEILWKYWTAALASGLLYLVVFTSITPVALFYTESTPLVRIGIASVIYPIFYLALIAVLYRGLKPVTMLYSLIKEMVAR
jgi:PST family polysaccharide transporter